MDRISRWKGQISGKPWYYDSNLVICDKSQNMTKSNLDISENQCIAELKMQINKDVQNQMNIEKKEVIKEIEKTEPEWKKDEEKILKGDKYTSFSYGGGRFGNQIIRNLAMSFLAQKFDLIMRYQRSEEIEKLGIILFSGKKNTKNTKL